LVARWPQSGFHNPLHKAVLVAAGKDAALARTPRTGSDARASRPDAALFYDFPLLSGRDAHRKGSIIASERHQKRKFAKMLEEAR
jgi:hypothetical protein